MSKLTVILRRGMQSAECTTMFRTNHVNACADVKFGLDLGDTYNCCNVREEISNRMQHFKRLCLEPSVFIFNRSRSYFTVGDRYQVVLRCSTSSGDVMCCPRALELSIRASPSSSVDTIPPISKTETPTLKSTPPTCHLFSSSARQTSQLM